MWWVLKYEKDNLFLRSSENILVQTLYNPAFLSYVDHSEAPLHIKSRQGAIGRGRGWVERIESLAF